LKNKVIEIKDLEDISPIFKGKIGHYLGKRVMHLFGMDKVNAVYNHSFNYAGADFAARLLNDVGVFYHVGDAERLRHLPEGAFITVSNHPYGGLDGIMLVDLMAGIRPDYKLMVNKFLSLIKTMDVNFISVTPNTNKKTESTDNINGIRETIKHLKDGHPVGFFPSGAVSDFSIKDRCVRDREWQESILKLIKKAKVPIVPIRFFDKNSTLFYFLGLINWRIRLIRLPHEVFNKDLKRTRIGIGEVISVEEQKNFTDVESFGEFLRKAVYDMPEPIVYTPRAVMDISKD
jgi:putative hemolysin